MQNAQGSTSELTSEQVERTGPEFSEEKILSAKKRAWEAVHEIAGRIRAGMLEEDAMRIAKDVLREKGAEKSWHRTYVRFGKNTLHAFGTPSDPTVRLGENDLFFIDLGPIFDGYEADVGSPYVVGNDPEMEKCARDCKEIYRIVRDKWFEGGISGARLYDFASEVARGMGWVLNVDNSNGHRLSDFPHNLYFKGGISEVDFHPKANRWVLEIHIRHPSRPFGAFYEDLLG